MITISECSVSCGVKVVGGETQYQTAAAFVKDFLTLRQLRSPNYTQFIFTHCTNPKSENRGAKPQEDNRCMGYKIEEFVKEHNLGIVVRSEPGTNPHHPERKGNPIAKNSYLHKDYEHKICVWVWTIPDNQVCVDYFASLDEKEKTNGS